VIFNKLDIALRTFYVATKQLRTSRSLRAERKS